MENLELELKLTVAHVNTVLQHLAKGVYSEVADLIQLLHGQSAPQVQAATIAPAISAPEAAPEVASETPASE